MVLRYVRAVTMAIVIATALLCGASQQSNEAGTPQFSEADAERLLSTLADGLIGHSPEKFLSAFDAGKMKDYSTFAEQVRTFFAMYENFRVHYRMRGVTEGTASAMVEFELEGDDAHSQVPGVRRSGEMPVTFQSGKSGWKITDLNRGFFR